jgi:hypothetical protein
MGVNVFSYNGPNTFWFDSLVGILDPNSAVGLFQNSLVLTTNTKLSDLHVATFPGFAYAGPNHKVTMTPGGILVECTAPVSFVQSAPAPPQTIFGYYVFAYAGLIYASHFDTPVVMQNLGDTITFNPTFNLLSQFAMG